MLQALANRWKRIDITNKSYYYAHNEIIPTTASSAMNQIFIELYQQFQIVKQSAILQSPGLNLENRYPAIANLIKIFDENTIIFNSNSPLPFAIAKEILLQADHKSFRDFCKQYPSLRKFLNAPRVMLWLLMDKSGKLTEQEFNKISLFDHREIEQKLNELNSAPTSSIPGWDFLSLFFNKKPPQVKQVVKEIPPVRFTDSPFGTDSECSDDEEVAKALFPQA